MKKTFACFLTLLVLAAFCAGCTSDSPNTTEESTATTTVTDAATTTVLETAPAAVPPAELSKTPAEEIIKSIAPGAKRIASSMTGREIILPKQDSAEAYIKAFTDAGYYDYPIDTVAGAKFTTNFLVGEKSTVAIYFHPDNKEVRIAWESATIDLALLSKNDLTDTGTLLFAQVGTERVGEKDNPLNGMIYIVKLSDGRAIIVDGGTGNTRNTQNIYDTLGKLEITKNSDGKFVIAAWIVTHAHGDHVGAPTLFADKHGTMTTVEHVIYNFTRDANVIGTDSSNISTFVSAFKRVYPNAKHIVAHANMNYYFGNATVSMLYTPELLYRDDKPLGYYNNSSLVFKIGVGDSSVFVMGDAANSACGILYRGYDATALKSDVLQITHHGLYTENNGHTWAFVENIYKAVDSELALLPMHEQYEADSRNGRYTVMKEWASAGHQISYVMNKRDLPDGMYIGSLSQAIWDEFELHGTVKGKKVDSLLGYDGNNVIKNANGMTTYMGGNRTDPMLVLLELDGAKTQVIENKELYEWLK